MCQSAFFKKFIEADENEKNTEEFQKAVKACEKAGIMVWFCGDYRGASFIPNSDKNNFENQLSLGLKNLFALSESYPDLKASQNFLSLQSSLMEIEDNIQNARRYYNATVRDFNTLVQAFPSNIIASKFNFKQKQYFELESKIEKSNPKVEF